jgi:hypothetical protein
VAPPTRGGSPSPRHPPAAFKSEAFLLTLEERANASRRLFATGAIDDLRSFSQTSSSMASIPECLRFTVLFELVTPELP